MSLTINFFTACVSLICKGGDKLGFQEISANNNLFLLSSICYFSFTYLSVTSRVQSLAFYLRAGQTAYNIDICVLYICIHSYFQKQNVN